MADLVRWEPFREMVSLWDAMDRLLDESFVPLIGERSLARRAGVRTLAVDMYETDDEVVVQASVPGVKPKDMSVTITGNVLDIRGETTEEKEEKRSGYYYRERTTGAFQRSLTLPVEVKSDKADATFENGVLTLRLPKAEEAKAKQIKIRAK